MALALLDHRLAQGAEEAFDVRLPHEEIERQLDDLASACSRGTRRGGARLIRESTPREGPPDRAKPLPSGADICRAPRLARASVSFVRLNGLSSCSSHVSPSKVEHRSRSTSSDYRAVCVSIGAVFESPEGRRPHRPKGGDRAGADARLPHHAHARAGDRAPARLWSTSREDRSRTFERMTLGDRRDR